MDEVTTRAGGGRDVPRNGRGQPLIKIQVPSKRKRDNGALIEKIVPYSRVSTFADILDDKTNLDRYHSRLAVAGLASLPQDELANLLPQIAAAHEGGDKNRLNAIVRRLQVAAGSEEKSEKGTLLHELSEYADRGDKIPDDVDLADVADIAAYMLATIDLQVECIEKFVVLDDYRVGGTPDRISFYAGPDPDGREPAGHLITDLKTGSVEYGGLKMAIQLACYAHGKLYDPATGRREPLPEDINQKWGLIINAPAGTATCTVWWIDLELGWEGFKVARQVRDLRNRGKKAFRPYPSATNGLATIETEPDDGEESE